MKIAFISDMHGSAWATRRVLEAADAWGADRIAVLGDVMNHGPRNPFPEEYDPMAVSELLNTRRDRVVAVRGNCDSEVDQMILQYPMMADYALLVLPERDIFLTHGHIYGPENPPALRPGSVLVFGHIHTPVIETGADGIVYFNPCLLYTSTRCPCRLWYAPCTNTRPIDGFADAVTHTFLREFIIK